MLVGSCARFPLRSAKASFVEALEAGQVVDLALGDAEERIDADVLVDIRPVDFGPIPSMTQFARWSGVAPARRGKPVSGDDTSRPLVKAK
jgi:hypothetical protein